MSADATPQKVTEPRNSTGPIQPVISPADRFASRRMTQDQLERSERVRDGFIALMETVEACVAPGRERALLTTELESASMWATKAISREPEPPA